MKSSYQSPQINLVIVALIVSGVVAVTAVSLQYPGQIAFHINQRGISVLIDGRK
jgi:hypothetical protein